MSGKTIEYELSLATNEFIRTSKAFEKAAKKLMAIMDRMKKKRSQELSESPEEAQWVHNFFIQIMDDSDQDKDMCFGIKCMAVKDQKQK